MIEPLFVSDPDKLKAALRLSGAKTEGAEAVIDQAVKDVRIGFYGTLGAAQVTALLAITDVDEPTSDDEISRALATSVEIKWVRKELLSTLPTLFMDSGGNSRRRWNEESAFTTKDPLDDELARLQAEIDAALGVLSGDSDLEDINAINVSTISPTVKPDYPGATVWPSLRNS